MDAQAAVGSVGDRLQVRGPAPGRVERRGRRAGPREEGDHPRRAVAEVRHAARKGRVHRPVEPLRGGLAARGERARALGRQPAGALVAEPVAGPRQEEPDARVARDHVVAGTPREPSGLRQGGLGHQLDAALEAAPEALVAGRAPGLAERAADAGDAGVEPGRRALDPFRQGGQQVLGPGAGERGPALVAGGVRELEQEEHDARRAGVQAAVGLGAVLRHGRPGAAVPGRERAALQPGAGLERGLPPGPRTRRARRRARGRERQQRGAGEPVEPRRAAPPQFGRARPLTRPGVHGRNLPSPRPRRGSTRPSGA